ncbi:hypothetical protein QR680_003716 [Steinernema hermaphroditum]|uniref:Uncharacterized protein n=1 Tax=Steinernema hermaphroditum TaxID=289476 RepID=A0AA39LSJ6_9BILA|nr:hypothetical protein QR680_003716 [Steinernema hermaphroditum]
MVRCMDLDLNIHLDDPSNGLDLQLNTIRIGDETFSVRRGHFNVDLLKCVQNGIPLKRATFMARTVNIEEYSTDTHEDQLRHINEIEVMIDRQNGVTVSCYGYVEGDECSVRVIRCTEDTIFQLHQTVGCIGDTTATLLGIGQFQHELVRAERFMNERGLSIGPIYDHRLFIDATFHLKIGDFSFVQPQRKAIEASNDSPSWSAIYMSGLEGPQNLAFDRYKYLNERVAFFFFIYDSLFNEYVQEDIKTMNENDYQADCYSDVQFQCEVHKMLDAMHSRHGKAVSTDECEDEKAAQFIGVPPLVRHYSESVRTGSPCSTCKTIHDRFTPYKFLVHAILDQYGDKIRSHTGGPLAKRADILLYETLKEANFLDSHSFLDIFTNEAIREAEEHFIEWDIPMEPQYVMSMATDKVALKMAKKVDQCIKRMFSVAAGHALMAKWEGEEWTAEEEDSIYANVIDNVMWKSGWCSDAGHTR